MTPPLMSKKSGFPRQLNDEIWVITLNLIVTFVNFIPLKKYGEETITLIVDCACFRVWAVS